MKTKYYEPAKIKERVSISQFLKDLGFSPVKKSGGESFYHSMIREAEKTPSFCVNERMGLWYDHGLGKGGDLIDLAQALWPDLNFSEVLGRIAGRSQEAFDMGKNNTGAAQSLIQEKPARYKINKISEIGGNKALADYLDFRGLKTIAGAYLKEVHYEVTLQGNRRKTFCAAGWTNEKGGWEIRNASFKGCLGKKGISVMSGNPSKLNLFEGFMDFLSWKSANPTTTDSVMVLNSVVHLKEVLQRAAFFPAVDVFFDTDVSGKQALSTLLDFVPHARDCADAYQGYKDYNQKHMAESPRHMKNHSGLQTTQLYRPTSGKR